MGAGFTKPTSCIPHCKLFSFSASCFIHSLIGCFKFNRASSISEPVQCRKRSATRCSWDISHSTPDCVGQWANFTICLH